MTIPGAPGTNGKPGRDGKNGRDGFPGHPGPQVQWFIYSSLKKAETCKLCLLH